METVKVWLKKMVEEDPDFNLNSKGEDYTPRAYRISIIKDLEVHEIIDFVKNDPLISDYSTLINKATLSYNQLRNGQPSVYETDKLSSFMYFITVTKKFDTKNIDEVDEFLKGVKENAFNFIEDNDEDSTTIEKLVYIGQTMNIQERFVNGHRALTEINKYVNVTKKIYIAQIHVLEASKEPPFVNYPECLDIINPPELVQNILKFLESLFITYYGIPESNHSDREPKVIFGNGPWRKIVGPELITICEYQNSILFKDGKIVSRDKIDDLLKPVIEKLLKKKRPFGDFHS